MAGLCRFSPCTLRHLYDRSVDLQSSAAKERCGTARHRRRRSLLAITAMVNIDVDPNVYCRRYTFYTALRVVGIPNGAIHFHASPCSCNTGARTVLVDGDKLSAELTSPASELFDAHPNAAGAHTPAACTNRTIDYWTRFRFIVPTPVIPDRNLSLTAGPRCGTGQKLRTEGHSREDHHETRPPNRPHWADHLRGRT